jgi:hypothetical protein
MTSLPNYYLISSSTLFYIPALYGINRGHRLLPMLSILSAGASIRYWSDPTNKYLKITDKLISRSSGIAYALYGLWTISTPQKKMIFWIDIILMLSTYHRSCVLYNGPHHQVWIPYHMMFHYFCMLSQLLVL